MNSNDLRKMIDAAEELTRAAQQHEVALKAALAALQRGEPWEEFHMGLAFDPLSQSLANWRGLMSKIFPQPEYDASDLAELAKTLESWK